MTFTLSTNIKNVDYENLHYIVTTNVQSVVGKLISDFNTGIRAFTLVGTYGTGKSSFLAALDRDLLCDSHYLVSSGVLNGYSKFKCINIIGEYCSLVSLLGVELGSAVVDANSVLEDLLQLIKQCKAKKTFVMIAIDEFGKVLEYAAKNNPESELYFFQKLAEIINDKKLDNVMLVTTLHQSFGAYARNLNTEQRQEWEKVKGRYREIGFSEPTEQLLYLAATQIELKERKMVSKNNFESIFHLARKSKFISSDFDIVTANRLYPLDIFSAVIITKACQRYGQNERSLFTFLMMEGENSLLSFEPKLDVTYNMSMVYDYIVSNFYSYLNEANSDSSNWRAIKDALDRIDSYVEGKDVEMAYRIVKTIGLCNMFGGAVKFDDKALCDYAKFALGIKDANSILDTLVGLKIIRYAKYKSQYIIYEGSDVNIEEEMVKASAQVAMPEMFVDDLSHYFDYRVEQANKVYYEVGTPRFFEYKLSEKAEILHPKNDTDGYINVVFPGTKEDKAELIEISSKNGEAVVYVCFNNVKEIVGHLHEIKKLEYIKSQVIVDDRIADREVDNLIVYEKDIINKLINSSLFSKSKDIEWYYKGKKQKIESQSDVNKLLSRVCEDVYHSTPKIVSELFNKQRVNSAVSTARVTLMNLLIDSDKVEQKDLGMDDDKFPPEKSIYYTLLKQTGIHREEKGTYILGAPTSDSIKDLWEKCDGFLKSTINKQRVLGDLIKDLKQAPFKLKQGFIDFWIPLYLIVKKQDYSLYDGEGRYIQNINHEVLELLQKNPSKFSVKAFAVDGIKLQYFNQYRRFLHADDKEFIKRDTFIETIKPFLVFYHRLDSFAKRTQNFDNPHTAAFRDVLSKAVDPEKTFFEDLPNALGFDQDELVKDDSKMSQYQEMMREVIRELRSCYQGLIGQIEEAVVEYLDLKSNNFETYQEEIMNRFAVVNKDLLTVRQKQFLKRLSIKQQNKTLWYESICYVVLDKALSSINDREVEQVIEGLKHLFASLSRCLDVSKGVKNKGDEAFSFEMVSTKGGVESQSFILPAKQVKEVDALETKINKILSGDNNKDVCALLRILKNKLEK